MNWKLKTSNLLFYASFLAIASLIAPEVHSSSPETLETQQTAQQQKTQQLPESLYSRCYQKLSSETINQFMREALVLKMGNKTDEAREKFELLATAGNCFAMNQLGTIAEEAKQYLDAVKWYVLALQEAWLQTSPIIGAAKNNLTALKENSFQNKKDKKSKKIVLKLKNCIKLGKDKRVFISFMDNFDKFLHTYQNNLNDLSIEILFETYASKFPEPYLTTAEHDQKTTAFQKVLIGMIPPEYAFEMGRSRVTRMELSGKPLVTRTKTSTPSLKYGMRFLKSAAQANVPDAVYLLALSYVVSPEIFNPQKAAKYMQQAADLGNPKAQLSYSRMLKNGKGVQINLKDSFKYCKQAAIGGNAAALFELGFRYLNGHGTVQDWQQARKHVKRATELDKDDASYLCVYGWMCFKGVGEEPDYKQALQNFTKIAEQKRLDSYILKIAEYFLGVIYKEGLGMTQPNLKRGLDYLERAANRGDVEAQQMLGEFYLEDPSIKENIEKSLNYLLQSTRSEAKILIALNYKTFYPKKDEEEQSECKRLIELADALCTKECGEQSSAQSTGIQGLKALLVDHDLEKARLWLSAALAGGEAWAKVALSRLEEEENLNAQSDEESDISSTSDEDSSSGYCTAKGYSDTTSEISSEEDTDDSSSNEPAIAKKQKAHKKSKADKRKEQQEKVMKKALKKMQRNLEKHKSLSVNDMTLQQNTDDVKLQISYLNTNIEKNYEQMLMENPKMEELMQDISSKPWAIEGAGQPEVLKGRYQGHKGCFSRRINHADRLVYKVIDAHKILILSCEGHYSNQS